MNIILIIQVLFNGQYINDTIELNPDYLALSRCYEYRSILERTYIDADHLDVRCLVQ